MTSTDTYIMSIFNRKDIMLRKVFLERIREKILDLMAKVKSDIQDIQLWVDDSPNSRVYRIRYAKVRDSWHELIEKHKTLSKIEYVLWQSIKGRNFSVSTKKAERY